MDNKIESEYPRHPREILRAVRNGKGLNQKEGGPELSEKCDWPESRWENLEKGSQEFQPSYLYEMVHGGVLEENSSEYLEIADWIELQEMAQRIAEQREAQEMQAQRALAAQANAVSVRQAREDESEVIGSDAASVQKVLEIPEIEEPSDIIAYAESTEYQIEIEGDIIESLQNIETKVSSLSYQVDDLDAHVKGSVMDYLQAIYSHIDSIANLVAVFLFVTCLLSLATLVFTIIFGVRAGLI